MMRRLLNKLFGRPEAHLTGAARALANPEFVALTRDWDDNGKCHMAAVRITSAITGDYTDDEKNTILYALLFWARHWESQNAFLSTNKLEYVFITASWLSYSRTIAASFLDADEAGSRRPYRRTMLFRVAEAAQKVGPIFGFDATRPMFWRTAAEKIASLYSQM